MYEKKTRIFFSMKGWSDDRVEKKRVRVESVRLRVLPYSRKNKMK